MNKKGATILELIISVFLFSIILMVAMAYYSTFRSSYMEQLALMKCQASARMAENHILTNLRRSLQDQISVSYDNTRLTLTEPSAGGDITEAYYVVRDIPNDTYNLVLLKNGNETVITENIDGADPDTGGFRVEVVTPPDTAVNFVNITLKTKISQRGTRDASYTTTASHKIRIDSD